MVIFSDYESFLTLSQFRKLSVINNIDNPREF